MCPVFLLPFFIDSGWTYMTIPKSNRHHLPGRWNRLYRVRSRCSLCGLLLWQLFHLSYKTLTTTNTNVCQTKTVHSKWLKRSYYHMIIIFENFFVQCWIISIGSLRRPKIKQKISRFFDFIATPLLFACNKDCW